MLGELRKCWGVEEMQGEWRRCRGSEGGAWVRGKVLGEGEGVLGVEEVQEE